MSDLTSKLKNIKPFTINLKDIMDDFKLNDINEYDIKEIRDKVLIKVMKNKGKKINEDEETNEGAWWSYLAEYLTGLSLVKKLNNTGNILVKDGVKAADEIEEQLRLALKKKIYSSPNGKKWWESNADKRVKMTKAGRAMADKIIEKLNKEKVLEEYVLSMVVASGTGTGGTAEKADIKLSFTPIKDYNITPRDIGVSIKTSFSNNSDLTVQSSIGKFTKFIALGEDDNKNVNLNEFITNLNESGLNKGPMVDVVKFLSLWKDITSSKNEFTKKYMSLTGFKGSALRTSLQDTITSIIDNESYSGYSSRKFKNKISEDIYNSLNNEYGDELRSEYSELLSSYPKETLSHSICKAVVDGVNAKFSSGTNDEWDKWKKYFLNWLGLGNGEWIIKSWYPNKSNSPEVLDVLDPNTNSGKAIKKLIDDFMNKDTKLEVIYIPEGGSATFKFQVVNSVTKDKYVAWGAHIIHVNSNQWTLKLKDLEKNIK
jgi:hypothetical protein